MDLVQFMGKDNVPFHTVIFPATLLGTGKPWTMMKSISVTEYLNYEDDKFSKSRGIGVFGNDAKETGIPPEVTFAHHLHYFCECYWPAQMDRFTRCRSEWQSRLSLLGNMWSFWHPQHLDTCSMDTQVHESFTGTFCVKHPVSLKAATVLTGSNNSAFVAFKVRRYMQPFRRPLQ